MRCFIAIELDNKTRNILTDVQKDLVEQGMKGKLTHGENLHLTLKFLGEIDESIYNEICKVIKKVAIRHQVFVLSLDNIGKFDKGNKKIVWAGLSENKNLLSLFRDIESELEGIMPIKKENYYIPHITLAREATLPHKEKIDTHEKLGHSFDVLGISLMESTRINGKLTYIRRVYEDFAAIL
ncbi:MAG: RNA 2',3'-cyclic phosphodiesterase [Clostridiaceae bacterium]|nr:RNA 2',3'-cyclic phosphodiesterase [Clostridiaceae bacterium]